MQTKILFLLLAWVPTSVTIAQESNDYRPFIDFPYGGPWGGSNDQGFQPYKYNGKELDRVHGLD